LPALVKSKLEFSVLHQPLSLIKQAVSVRKRKI